MGRPNIGTPEAALECAARAGFDWTGAPVSTCAGPNGGASGVEGLQLLQKSVNITADMGIT